MVTRPGKHRKKLMGKSPFLVGKPNITMENHHFSWENSLFQWAMFHMNPLNPLNPAFATSPRCFPWLKASFWGTTHWINGGWGTDPRNTINLTLIYLFSYLLIWLFIYVFIYLDVCKYVYIYIHIYMYTYIYIHIYIYTRNAWALPQRCSVEGSHSQSNVTATLHSIGKINKGIREY